MAFKKDTIIYEKKPIRIFINQCHNKGKKTRLFAIRRDDNTGLSALLGGITFSGRWRQYIFMPENNTIWNKSCLSGIINFLDKINKEERKKWQKKKLLKAKK